MLYRYIYISLYFPKDNIIYMVFYTSLFSLTNISWDLGMIDFCSTEISGLSFILMYWDANITFVMSLSFKEISGLVMFM